VSDIDRLLKHMQQDRDLVERFRADPAAALEDYRLSEAQSKALRHRDVHLRSAIEGAGALFLRGIWDEPPTPEPPSPEPPTPEPPTPEPPSPEPPTPEPTPEPPTPEPTPEPPTPEPPTPEPPTPEPPSPEPTPEPFPFPFPFDPHWPPAPVEPPSPVLPTILPPPINDYKVIVKIWPLGIRESDLSGERIDPLEVQEVAQLARTTAGQERLAAITRLMELI
jgi:hypothetical protein